MIEGEILQMVLDGLAGIEKKLFDTVAVLNSNTIPSVLYQEIRANALHNLNNARQLVVALAANLAKDL